MDRDGSVVVQSGTQDIGTGTYTVMTQVAADALGVPMQRIRFELGDSALPPAPVSGGSLDGAECGAGGAGGLSGPGREDQGSGHRRSAWRLARPVARTRCRCVMAWWSGRIGGCRSPRCWTTASRASLKPRSKTQARATRRRNSRCTRSARSSPRCGSIRIWAKSASAAIVGAFDGGHILNAKTARSQLIGGITYGIGMALLEETLVDGETGRIVNANVAEYLMPVNADIPDIQTIVVDERRTNSNPLGVKGIGELPMVGVAAAIANAVYHATGVRVRKVPIRIEDVLV